ELQERYVADESPRVFYQINDPLIFTVGGPHIISEAIETCGGDNIFAELGAGAHAVTLEAVLARSPDVVLIGAHTESLHASASQWQDWPGMQGRVFVIDAADIARPTLRMLDGVRQICKRLEQARRSDP